MLHPPLDAYHYHSETVMVRLMIPDEDAAGDRRPAAQPIETVPLVIGLVLQLHRAYDDLLPEGIVRPSRQHPLRLWVLSTG